MPHRGNAIGVTQEHLDPIPLTTTDAQVGRLQRYAPVGRESIDWRLLGSVDADGKLMLDALLAFDGDEVDDD